MEGQVQTYSRVLIPIEDLYFADTVIDFIANHQWAADTQFRVLHARQLIFPVPLMGGLPVAPSPVNYQEEIGSARRLVDNIVRRLDLVTDRSIEGYVEEGQPDVIIIDYAKKWPADLIIMASHGRHGLERLFVGSVSGAVTTGAPCSIIVLHPKQAAA